MSRRVRLRPEAELEIGEAASWYAERGLGLGTAFLDEVSRVLQLARKAPDQFPVERGSIRKGVLRRFPYIVLFRADPEELLVISCFHTRRDPRDWRSRL